MRRLLSVVLCLLITSSSARSAPDRSDLAWDGTLRRLRVPILMYHYVSELPPDADDIRRGLTVTPSLFQAHMQYLHDAGFNTISLYDLNAALVNGVPLPANPIVLTFDDGYRDAYTTVFPILKRYGFIGTFFVITARADANDTAYLTWSNIKEMSDSGMSMEPHTKDHLDLRQRDHDFLIYQMKGSIESLAAYTGHVPRMFSYPVGHYDRATLAVARELGVWIAVATGNGDMHSTAERLYLPRLRVLGNMSVNALAATLRP